MAHLCFFGKEDNEKQKQENKSSCENYPRAKLVLITFIKIRDSSSSEGSGRRRKSTH